MFTLWDQNLKPDCNLGKDTAVMRADFPNVELRSALQNSATVYHL